MKIHEPAMTFKNDGDKAEWDKGVEKNQDPYGNAIYRYTSEWATKMEEALKADGATVGSVAKGCSHDVDTEGITGFMYGCAVSILASVWIHGEELRKWHNLDTQIGNEGVKANEGTGVLTPALLNIG